MTTNLCEKPDNHGAGWVIAVVIITMLLFVTAKCHAQQKAAIDTIVCKVECIKQIVQKPSTNGKTVKYMAVYRDWETDRKSTRLNSSHSGESRMPSSA